MTKPRTAPFRDRVVELRRVRAAELAEHPRNWRTHPRRQREALRAMLEEVGLADAVIARQRDDGRLELIDGHLRRSLDPDQVLPVLVLDVTEAEADSLLATLDPLASLAGAEPQALRDLLARVETSSEEVRRLFAEMLAGAGQVPAGADPEDIPALAASPRCRPGEVFELGGHRVACGDARDPDLLRRLMGAERATLVVTDPPYGVGYEGKTRDRLRLAGDEEGIPQLLSEAFAALDPVLRQGAAVYLFHPAGPGAVAFLQALAERWSIRQLLVWRKDAMVLGHADYHFGHEGIAYARKRGPGRWGRGGAGWYGGHAESTVLEVPRPQASPEHPTAKPVELIRRLLANSSAPNDVVLDPFLGSGSTLVAAEGLGRRCVGAEIDPRYADVAIRRWERLTGRAATRVGTERGR